MGSIERLRGAVDVEIGMPKDGTTFDTEFQSRKRKVRGPSAPAAVVVVMVTVTLRRTGKGATQRYTAVGVAVRALEAAAPLASVRAIVRVSGAVPGSGLAKTVAVTVATRAGCVTMISMTFPSPLSLRFSLRSVRREAVGRTTAPELEEEEEELVEDDEDRTHSPLALQTPCPTFSLKLHGEPGARRIHSCRDQSHCTFLACTRRRGASRSSLRRRRRGGRQSPPRCKAP